MTRFKEYYNSRIRLDLLKKLNYHNLHQVPKLEKIIINMGFKQEHLDKKNLLLNLIALELITGQKGITTKAKKSIASFKIREGMEIGCKVTLRNDAMYLFLHYLVTIILPSIREFHGFSSRSFDKNGNFAFGIQDYLIFPEIQQEYDKYNKNQGMNILIITNTTNNAHAKILLSAFQIPFN